MILLVCGGGRTSCWDFGDGAIGRDRKVRVHQGFGDIRHCLQERAEKLGRVHPYYDQDQVNADDAVLVYWRRWDDICECSHL